MNLGGEGRHRPDMWRTWRARPEWKRGIYFVHHHQFRCVFVRMYSLVSISRRRTDIFANCFINNWDHFVTDVLSAASVASSIIDFHWLPYFLETTEVDNKMDINFLPCSTDVQSANFRSVVLSESFVWQNEFSCFCMFLCHCSVWLCYFVGLAVWSKMNDDERWQQSLTHPRTDRPTHHISSIWHAEHQHPSVLWRCWLGDVKGVQFVKVLLQQFQTTYFNLE